MGKPGGQRSAVEPAHLLFGREYHPLDVFFHPQSVAVIGATEAEGSVGRTTLWNLISSPFGGIVYPVNPRRNHVLGMRCYKSVRDLPEPAELAIVVTPAATVPGVIRECVETGVRGAIILAAGFRELGEQGAALEAEVMAEARKGSLRILGPNSLGVMSPVTGLNATFAHSMARGGSVAFVSQSGALCTAVLDWSHRELVGFSAFVSIGNMADVGWGDVIDYLGDDPRTRSILIYMESIGDARAFLSAAREVAMAKPIIVIKAGRTPDGARAARAHTGALAGDDEVINAAFRRCGVLRVHRISDLFGMAELLAKQPRPRGKRLAIVTNAGGPGVLAADSLVTQGGELAGLSPESLSALNAALPAEWSHGNPVDILADATPERYTKTLEVVTKDPNTDGVLVVLAPQATTDPSRTAEAVRAFAKLPGRPVLASWMGGADVAAGVGILRNADVPTFAFPDTAIRMFVSMWAYNENLRLIYETPMADPAEVQPDEAAAVIGAVRARGATELDEGEAARLLSSYGVATVDHPEVVIGVRVDDQLGPVLFFGGGAEDQTVALPPLTTTLARRMIERTAISRRLGTAREELELTLVRVSRLAAEQRWVRFLKIDAAGAQVTLHDPATPVDELPCCVIRPYPVEYASPWRMKNGEEVIIRPIRAEDEPLIAAFHETLSERTVYFRYLSALKLSTRIAHERLIRNCFIDYARQMVLVVEREGAIIGVGRLHKDVASFARGKREGEFALVVSDAFQGQGLGVELLRRLIEVARKEGFDSVFGDISAENRTMQAVCRKMGFTITRDFSDPTVTARLKLG
jgi:acetyl coenzyme A synthetase (ADP forming)-like protein